MHPNAQPHYDQGRQHYDHQDYEAALSSFQAALEWEKSSADLWTRVADCYYQLDEDGPAEEACAKALALDDTHSRAWFRRGTLLSKQKKYSEALTTFEQAIALAPQDSYPWNGKGSVLAELGQYPEALAAYEQAIALAPLDAPPWYGKGNVLKNLGQYLEALAAYEQAIALDPQGALSWNGKGNVLANLGRYSEALAAFDQVITLDPQFAHPWHGKGESLRSLGQYFDALAAYEQAIVLDPQDALPWNGKGNALANLGQHPEALAAYDQSIAFDSQFAHPWQGKGVIFQRTQNLTAAHTCYLRCFALDRNYYLTKILTTHLDLLANYPQPAWLQTLYLYLPDLPAAQSWSSLARRAEAQNHEADGLMTALDASALSKHHGPWARALLSYYLGNPFRTRDAIEALWQEQPPTLEQTYYWLLALEGYAEPLVPFQAEVEARITAILARHPSKANHYWAGQIVRLLQGPGPECLSYFERAGSYLPALYMRLALKFAYWQELDSQREDLALALDMRLKRAEKKEKKAALKQLEEEIEAFEPDLHALAQAIYNLEKHLIYGEDLGYLRFLQQDQPFLALGLADFITQASDYQSLDAFLNDRLSPQAQERRQHFRQTARHLLKSKTAFEIKEGLWAVQSYITEFPATPLASLADPERLADKLDAFQAVQLLSGRIRRLDQSNDVAFEAQMQRLEAEPQLKELLTLQRSGNDVLDILTARIEARYWDNHPNPNIGNHMLMYFFWRGDLPQRDFMLLLSYQYLQQYGSSARTQERWLKNGLSFLALRLLDYYSLTAFYKVLRTAGVLDLNNLIDHFFRALNPQYQLPDYLTFKRDFELHLTHLQEELGHDFQHQFPLPEGF